MFKLGKLTDYGTVLMTALARQPEALRNAQDLAVQTHLALPTVAKLLRQLARAGLVESHRGALGGYRLARAPDRISVADIVCALEGPIALTECSVHSGCGIEAHCDVKSHWRVINDAIRTALDAVTLAQMAHPSSQRAHTKRPDVPIHFKPASART